MYIPHSITCESQTNHALRSFLGEAWTNRFIFDPMADSRLKFYVDRVVSENSLGFLLGRLRHFLSSAAPAWFELTD